MFTHAYDSISSDSEDDRNESSMPSLQPSSFLRILRPSPERPGRPRLHRFTLYSLGPDGGAPIAYDFLFERRPLIPRVLYSESEPSLPYHPNCVEARISHSFRTSRTRNVKVVITKGRYKNKQGVIVQSYCRKKSLHKVLTADGCVTSIKQIYLRRLDASFLLPYGIPVSRV